MIRKLKLNSLFTKILLVVVIGVLCVSISVGYTIINLSKGIFTDNYSESQKKIFDQVSDEIYNFHSEIVKVIDYVNSNKAFRTYFTEKDLSNMELSKTIYEFKKQMKSSLASNTYDMSVLVVGLNVQSYLNSAELLTIDSKEILDLDINK